MFVYCNTNDSPRIVGELICRANFINNSKKSWNIINQGDSYTIQTNSTNHCVAVIYYVGNSVVGIEIDNNCASAVIEPLIRSYGFEKVKWLLNY